MKKFYTLLILLSLLFSTIILEDVMNVNAYQEELQTSGTDAFSAYAYELRLIRYEKKGDTPTEVGNPILVYNKILFDDIIGVTINSGGKLPSTFDDMYSGKPFSITQTSDIPSGVSPDHYGTTETSTTVEDTTTTHSTGEPDTPTTVTEYGDGDKKTYRYTIIGGRDIKYGPQKERVPASGKNDKYREKVYRYSSGAKKANFYGKDVVIPKEYKGHLYEDNNLTQDNIEKKNYLHTLMVKYGGTRENIEKYFGYKIQDMEIHKYYIQAVPVQRVPDYDNLKSVGSYVVKNLINKVYEGRTWTLASWYKDGTGCDCPSGYSCDDSCTYKYCPSEYSSYTNCKTSSESTVCTTGSCSGTTGGSCTYAGIANLGKYCTTKTYTDHTATGSGTTYPLYSLSAYPGYLIRHTIFGTLMEGPSLLKTAQETGKYKERAVNSCGTTEAKHCILNQDGVTCSGSYEYYVGPNKENALVGIGNDYSYQLIGKCNSDASYDGYKHLYVPDIISHDCKKDICNSICDTNQEWCLRSSDYLKCAENYCESMVDYDIFRQNARNVKKNCMLFNCQYRYGRDPNTLSKDHNNANLQSEDGCTNSVIDGIASRYGKTELKVFDSKCNVALDNTGHYVPTQDIKGKYVTPCEGDYITDFNGNDADDKTFDQRTYINSICKLVVDSEFTDTTKIKLAAGLGFTYPIVHGGYEYCTYFINKEQWKFDYATIPARNTKYQRDRMLLILKNFNDEVSKVNPDNSNMTAGTQALKAEGNLDGEGKTNFEGNGFDFSKSTIKTTTKEYKLEELNPETKTTELEVEKNSTGSSMKATVALQTDDVDQVTMVADRNISTISINQYTSQSGGRLTYTLKKVCLRTDGTAEVYEAPGNNECYKTGVGANQETIHGSSTHYTSFEIKPNVENPIKASVEVKAKDGPTYYNVDETCTYKVAQSDYMCRIKFDSNGTKLGNKQYESSSVTATIVYDIPSSQIAKVEIDDTGNIQEVIDNKITIVNHNSRSVETHNVTGIITLNNGETVTCPDNVDLYSGPVCGASCRIERAPEDTSGKLYNMTVYNADLYYTYTTYHDIPTLTEFNSRKMDSEPYSYMKKITKSVTNTTNKLEIRLDKPLEKGELILGYVTNSSNKKCNAYCYKSYDEPNTTLDCYAKEKNLDQVKIKEYCKTNWANDINGFKDEEDCFKKCRVPCPQKTSDYNTINNYCDGYASYGFSDKESCINKCYKPIEDDPQDEPYIFRSINVANPFPNSEETEEPYEKGKRIVGTNWRGLSHYITNDENDKTSVTGPNSNEMVEYIIDMTAEDIRQIREDTEKTGEGYKNKRRVYARLDRITTGSTDKVQEYKSSFIRESKFSALFKNSHGIGSRTIHATYPDFK